MSPPIRFAIPARKDRARLAAFLADNSPNAAMRALAAITEGLSELAEHPRLGRSCEDGLRERLIRFGSSGYVVRYRIQDDAILIARIFHMRESRD